MGSDDCLWSTTVCGLAVGTRQDDVCLAELGRTGEGSGARAQGQ